MPRAVSRRLGTAFLTRNCRLLAAAPDACRSPPPQPPCDSNTLLSQEFLIPLWNLPWRISRLEPEREVLQLQHFENIGHKFGIHSSIRVQHVFQLRHGMYPFFPITLTTRTKFMTVLRFSVPDTVFFSYPFIHVANSG